MQEEETLSYSIEAERNRYLFYSDSNDINIFVEDKDKEYEYETIFRRIFKDNYTINSIFALGGKMGMKKGFKEFGPIDRSNKKRNIFIVDGDFDRIIHSSEMIFDDSFIYLKTYNIENYYVDKRAILSFAKGKMKTYDEDVETALDLDGWRSTFVPEAKKLFFLYCAVQKSMEGEPTVGRKEHLTIDKETGCFNVGNYTSFYNEIKGKNDKIDEEISWVKKEYESLYNDDGFSIICGKYLLTSLFDLIQCNCKKMGRKCQMEKDDMKWWLINNFDIKSLGYLKEMILKIANGVAR